MIRSIICGVVALCIQGVAMAGPLEEERRQTIERITLNLNAGEADLTMLPEVYTPEATFTDPMLGDDVIQGYEELHDYHETLNDMTTRFDVRILSHAVDGHRHILLWEADLSMDLVIDLGEEVGPILRAIPGMNRKISFKFEDMKYEGTTVFEFSEGEARVTDHKDIYNEMIMYEKMPVVGPVLKTMRRLSKMRMLGQ